MVVYVAGENEDEFTVLKRRLHIREKEINRLKGLSQNSYALVAEKDRDLAVSQKYLDNKSYKIMQLARKLDEQEAKIDELTNALAEISNRNNRANIKNQEMRKRLHALQAKYGIAEDDEDDISSEHDEIEEDVKSWGVEKVLSWWRRNLPRSAQSYTPMVRECQMSGKDLLELDMGMLQTFGMKKLLARQIMAQIDPLRIEHEAHQIDPVHAKVYSKMERQEDAELSRLRGMDKVNPESKAQMNGLLTDVLSKNRAEN